MAITQNDLEFLKSEIMADTTDGGGLPTNIAVVDGVSNNLFPDVSDIDRLVGKVRLRKLFAAMKTVNTELLQATRLLFTELPENPNISVFMFKATSFADRRANAKNKIESYLAFGQKTAGHVLETQLADQRVIQISLDLTDTLPSLNQPLVIVQNEGETDEFYQYLRPIKIDSIERRFQLDANEFVIRRVVTLEFGVVLSRAFNGLSVPEFYNNFSTKRRAVLREARVADAAKYYSASHLAEPVTAMTSRQVRLDSIYTQVVPSTLVETPILQRDAAIQTSSQLTGSATIAITRTVNVSKNTALNLAGGIAVGTLNLNFGGSDYIDRRGEIVNLSGGAVIGSISYGAGQITWYNDIGSVSLTGSYKPASDVRRVAQTDFQIVGDRAGFNFIKELGAVPMPNSVRVIYTVQGTNYAVRDDGRGNLIDEDGNGRGVIIDNVVQLLTAAIPDAESYITYAFDFDVGLTKYSAQALNPAYHLLSLGADKVSGNITITWSTGSATLSGSTISGDATGKMIGSTILIAPKTTVPSGTVFSLSYNRIIAGGTKTASSQSTSTSVGEAILGASVQVTLGAGTRDVINVTLRSDSTSNLYVENISSSSGHSSPWDVVVSSATINKASGSVSVSLSATRTEKTVDVFPSRRIGRKNITRTTTNVIPYTQEGRQIVMFANTVNTTEAATASVTINDMYISLPVTSSDPIVEGSLLVKAFNDNLIDASGVIKRNAESVGTIDYLSGLIRLTTWNVASTNIVSLSSMLRGNNTLPVAAMVFRSPVAPLKNNEITISLKLLNGTNLTLTTDAQGKITGSPYAHGEVNFKLGVAVLYFYEVLKISDNTDVVGKSWYDPANIYDKDGSPHINRPVYIDPNTVRYNAIAYTYLPLDKELIGLDPARLPTDGRVPFVRKGDSIAITELKLMQLPTNAANNVFNLGYERLSDVNVIDSTGKKVSFDYLDIDLDAGTLKLKSTFNMTGLTAPLTAKYRIMDIALVADTDISGRVTLSTLITHSYSTAAVFSSMLVVGDMQARAFNVFSQKSWTSVFSDLLIGDRATSQLQIADYPIVVTNRDAIEERWALVFTGTNSFRIIGEVIGEIGTGSTTVDCSPINPLTAQPYFKILKESWGTGWSANNVVRINTGAAKYPVWVGNAIQQHQGSSSDNYDFTIGYHANIDRERV